MASFQFGSYLAWLRRHPIHRILLFVFWLIGQAVVVVQFLLYRRPRTVADVLREAEADAGSSDYGEAGEREKIAFNLQIIMRAFSTWLPYGPLNTFAPKLSIKLQIIDHLKRHPSPHLEALPRRPVFIISMPRAGSTLLHNLLALDEGARAMRGWELRKPLPPPTKTSAGDPRIAAFRKELESGYAYGPLIKAIHLITAEGPDECVNGYFPDYSFPVYSWGAEAMDEAYAWYTSSRMEGQFRDYRRLLQVLCSDNGAEATHTVLKAPHHLFHLETLAEVFPDAAFVWLHREPAAVVRSCCNMNLHVHEYTSVEYVPTEVMGQRTLRRLAQAVHTAAAARAKLAAPPHSFTFVDVRYSDLMADPVACCEQIYKELGLHGSSWRPKLASAIAAYVASHEQADRPRLPPHQNLTLRDFGLDVAAIDEVFGPYASSRTF